MTTPQAKALSDRSFAIQHTFRAPASKVFAAYTDPKQVAQWWAPKGGSLRVETMEVRPGGQYRYVQSNADGRTLTFMGSYLEVRPFTRLVYTFQVEGQGAPVTTTIELAEAGGATSLTLTSVFPSKEAYDVAAKYGAVAGAKAAMATLAAFLGA